MTNKTKNSGETLIEILVSTVILITVVTSAFVFLNRGVATNLGLTNRIIAIEIAREGLEAVRNIRDTNWLKYSGDRRAKWLCVDEQGEDTCSGINVTAIDIPGFYRAEFSEDDKRYYIEEPDVGSELLDLANNSAGYENFQLFETSSGRLVHDNVDNTPTIFYRQIELIPETNALNEEKLKVISRVQWSEVNTYPSTVLETHLFDFYERDAY
ncbi:type II secretion system GspH family protein [Candidatus Gracilibacteria bacterium]|nr:type II secretion system GspH family protein [Candidatus Gracilibacteria bacterium]